MRGERKERVSDWYFFTGISLWLGFQAIWRLTVPAREMLNAPFATPEFYIDLAMLAAVIWGGVTLAKRSDGPEILRSARPILVIVGVLGGLTVLWIRLLTEDGWFTGRLSCCAGLTL